MILTCEQRRELVEMIENGTSISAACKILEISRPIGYKWLQRFYDDGYDGLEDHSSAPKSFPNKIPQEIKERVLKISMEFPDFGASGLANKLTKLDVKISAPTIQSILKQSNRSTRWDRFLQNLNEYNNKPNTFSDNTLKRMESISKNFKYRSLFTEKPGQRVFIWPEFGYVAGSSKKIPLFIFLDMCGLFIYVYYPQNILKRKRPWYLSQHYSEKNGSHLLTDSIMKVYNNIYKPLAYPIKELTVFHLDQNNNRVLQQEVEDHNIKIKSIVKSDFYKLPFINKVHSIIRSRLKKPLTKIRFEGQQLITEIEILELIQLFHNNYNKEHVISEYPNLGTTPFDYLTQYKHQNIINQIIALTNKPLDRKKALAIKYNLF